MRHRPAPAAPPLIWAVAWIALAGRELSQTPIGFEPADPTSRPAPLISRPTGVCVPRPSGPLTAFRGFEVIDINDLKMRARASFSVRDATSVDHVRHRREHRRRQFTKSPGGLRRSKRPSQLFRFSVSRQPVASVCETVHIRDGIRVLRVNGPAWSFPQDPGSRLEP
jgi:hypothetical protein